MKIPPADSLVAFAITGVVSGILMTAEFTVPKPLSQATVGLPFAVVCAMRCCGANYKGVAVAIGQVLVWLGAFNLSQSLYDAMREAAPLAGGLAGGIGVWAVTALAVKELRRWPLAAGSALLGCLGGAPFWYFLLHDTRLGWCFAFAFWQVLVGTPIVSYARAK